MVPATVLVVTTATASGLVTAASVGMAPASVAALPGKPRLGRRILRRALRRDDLRAHRPAMVTAGTGATGAAAPTEGQPAAGGHTIDGLARRADHGW
jgi:hypothetical protein